MANLELRGTGTCFDDVAEYFTRAALGKTIESRSMVICHGILLAPDGHPYAHAWLEYGADSLITSGVLPDGQIGYATVFKSEYYAESRVTADVTRYTMSEALALDAKHKTSGPWEERYLLLCRDATVRKVKKLRRANGR